MCCYGQLVINLMQLDLSVFVLNLFSSVQSFSRVGLFATPWTAACQASLSITNPGAYSSSCPSTWWCHPTISSCLPLLFLPSIFPNIRVFSNEWILPIRWAKNWSLNFSISFSSEYSRIICLGWAGLISLHSKGLSRVFSNTTVPRVYMCVIFQWHHILPLGLNYQNWI